MEQFYKRLSLHAGGTSKTVVHGSVDRRGTTLVRQALLIMENRVRIHGHSHEATFRLAYGTLSSPGSRDGCHRRQNRAGRYGSYRSNQPGCVLNDERSLMNAWLPHSAA